MFAAGLRDATRRDVKLTIEPNVDVHAAKRIAMTSVQLLRQYRGVTDLSEVRINSAHGLFKPTAYAAVDPNLNATNGSTLWFNAEHLRPGTIAKLDTDIKAMAHSGFSTPAYQYGLEGVVAHEVGHLIGFAAMRAAEGTHLQNALAQRTINSLSPAQRAEVQVEVATKYRSEADWYKNASSLEIVGYHKAQLKAAGLDDNVQVNPDHVRSELLAALPSTYYGAGPRNELSGASAAKVSSRYSAQDVREQQGESFAALTMLGEHADVSSRATCDWMMEALNRKWVDRSREILNYRDVLVADAKEAGALEYPAPPMPAYPPSIGAPGGNPLGNSPLPGNPLGGASPQPPAFDIGIAGHGMAPAAGLQAGPAPTFGADVGLGAAPQQSLGYGQPSLGAGPKVRKGQTLSGP